MLRGVRQYSESFTCGERIADINKEDVEMLLLGELFFTNTGWDYITTPR